MSNTRDPQNPYTPVMANDKGEELIHIVMTWMRGFPGTLSSAQQTAVITAITGILNGTFRV